MSQTRLLAALAALAFIPVAATAGGSKYDKKSVYGRHMESAHPSAPGSEPQWYDTFIMAPWELPGSILADAQAASAVSNRNTIVETGDASPMQNESSIAVNPKNPLNLIASAVDYRANSSTWVYVSDDGGKTWRNINLGKPFPSWAASNDPSVMFDSDGVGYLCYGGFNRTGQGLAGNGVFLARTEDQGKTWKAHMPVMLHTGPQTPDSAFEDKYYVHVDNSPSSPTFGRLYIPWKRVYDADSSTTIVVTWSDDKGESWQTPVAVSQRLSQTSEDTTFGQSFPLTTTSPDGTVHTVWNWGPARSIGYARSTDAGLTWSAPQKIHTYRSQGVARQLSQGIRHTVKGMVRAETYPTIAVDQSDGPRRGWIYLAWSADEVPNVYFSRSTDGGTTWSSPVICQSDTTNDQFWPWLAVDQTNGDVAIMYFDSRLDPTNIGVDCFVSYSSDGGTTWVDARASDTWTDLRRNPFEDRAFAGDYSGCAFHGGIIYPSWFDSRNTGSSLANSDVYTAIVPVSAPRPVRQLRATVLAEDATRLQLRWENPTQTVFGAALSTDRVQLEIVRNGELVGYYPYSTVELDDSGLEPHARYTYSIRVAVDADTSIVAEVSAWSGGARAPMPPAISAVGTGEASVPISVLIPALRADSVTPWANPRLVRLYRDGVQAVEQEISVADTGRVVVVGDTPPERGWWRYSCEVVDAAGNVSGRTPEQWAYFGPVESGFTTGFDEAFPRWRVGGGFVATSAFARSAPNSLTESPGGQYGPQQRDTILFFPMLLNTESVRRLSFWHVALVDPADSALVETSWDGGRRWQRVATYNKSLYPEWGDGQLDAADWKRETVTLAKPDGAASDTVLVRLRFASNPFRHDDGWYVDDIAVGTEVSAQEQEAAKQLLLWPNPASSSAVLEGLRPGDEVSVYTPAGSVMMPAVTSSQQRLVINTAQWSSGMYFARVVRADGTASVLSFVIHR